MSNVKPGDKVLVCFDVLEVTQEPQPVPGHPGLIQSAGSIKLGIYGDPTDATIFAGPDEVMPLSAVMAPELLEAIKRVAMDRSRLMSRISSRYFGDRLDEAEGNQTTEDEARWSAKGDEIAARGSYVTPEDLALIEKAIQR
jgi:hypothetical protein